MNEYDAVNAAVDKILESEDDGGSWTEDAFDALGRKVKTLQRANQGVNGWREVVIEGHDPDTQCTQFQKIVL